MINNQEHAVQIRAVNADGKGAHSAQIKGTPIDVPAKPTGLTAKTGGTQAFLSWSDPSDSSITSYQIRTRIGSGADIVIGAYTGKKLTLEWTALNNSSITKYQHSNNGSWWQDIQCSGGSTCPQGTPMSHPVNVSLNYGNQYTYQVRGYISNNNTVAVTDLKVWEEISTSATATSHKADGLTAGTTYTFSLRAVNSTGNGLDATVTSTAMTVPSKPATFTATPRHQSVDLAWTYSNPNDDYVLRLAVPAVEGQQRGLRGHRRRKTGVYSVMDRVQHGEHHQVGVQRGREHVDGHLLDMRAIQAARRSLRTPSPPAVCRRCRAVRIRFRCGRRCPPARRRRCRTSRRGRKSARARRTRPTRRRD